MRIEYQKFDEALQVIKTLGTQDRDRNGILLDVRENTVGFCFVNQNKIVRMFVDADNLPEEYGQYVLNYDKLMETAQALSPSGSLRVSDIEIKITPIEKAGVVKDFDKATQTEYKITLSARKYIETGEGENKRVVQVSKVDKIHAGYSPESSNRYLRLVNTPYDMMLSNGKTGMTVELGNGVQKLVRAKSMKTEEIIRCCKRMSAERGKVIYLQGNRDMSFVMNTTHLVVEQCERYATGIPLQSDYAKLIGEILQKSSEEELMVYADEIYAIFYTKDEKFLLAIRKAKAIHQNIVSMSTTVNKEYKYAQMTVMTEALLDVLKAAEISSKVKQVELTLERSSTGSVGLVLEAGDSSGGLDNKFRVELLDLVFMDDAKTSEDDFISDFNVQVSVKILRETLMGLMTPYVCLDFDKSTDLKTGDVLTMLRIGELVDYNQVYKEIDDEVKKSVRSVDGYEGVELDLTDTKAETIEKLQKRTGYLFGKRYALLGRS